MTGKGYDGAANMSSCHRGVKARIQLVVPRTLYTHCKAHSSNLASIHASKEHCARNIMTTVQVIAFCFQYSAKMLIRFKNSLSIVMRIGLRWAGGPNSKLCARPGGRPEPMPFSHSRLHLERLCAHLKI
ncbi:hypothetical protein DPMN_095367 [Dreissena polymorpha]|uniref:Uncharacterized protein n=1 Tax=Dreissena polymorpha TaxID=45954 RepID=A0A9D4L786_DREPO|nr:hypothetical protein DPMN_095367 [Dreissena polymorpha]